MDRRLHCGSTCTPYSDMPLPKENRESDQKRRSLSFLLFLILSATLHLVLLRMAAPVPKIDVTATLSLKVTHPSQPTPLKEPVTAPEITSPTVLPTKPPVVSARATPESPALPRPAVSEKDSSLETRETSIRETPTPTIGTGSEQNRSHILAGLRRDFDKHFHYPRLARKRGWEGEVVIGFIVNPAGRIDEARILRSSGHTVLDKAAIQSFLKVKRLSADLLPGDLPLNLELPVIYRLKKG